MAWSGTEHNYILFIDNVPVLRITEKQLFALWQGTLVQNALNKKVSKTISSPF